MRTFCAVFCIWPSKIIYPPTCNPDPCNWTLENAIIISWLILLNIIPKFDVLVHCSSFWFLKPLICRAAILANGPRWFNRIFWSKKCRGDPNASRFHCSYVTHTDADIPIFFRVSEQHRYHIPWLWLYTFSVYPTNLWRRISTCSIRWTNASLCLIAWVWLGTFLYNQVSSFRMPRNQI